MANVIAEAAVRIRPDTSGFQSETQSHVLGVVKKIAVAAAAAFAATKIFDFGEQAVSEAAQTQKSLENVKASYGQMSKSITAFADTAAAKYGISRQASLAFSSSLAVSARNLGLSRAEAAKETIGYQKLAGSLGSIKGIDPASVFDKLSLAMLGNTRGLKQLGISFSSAQQKQEALRLGIKGSTADWTSAQKAQVIYALATSHLGSFMDQAKKHSGDLIDVQHRLTAEWANAKEEVGVALLPVLERLGGVLVRYLPTGFALVGAAAHGFGALVARISSAIAPLVSEIQKLVGEFQVMYKATGSVSFALREVSYTLLRDLGVSMATSRTIINDVTTILAKFRDVIKENYQAILGIIAPVTLLFTTSGKLREVIIALVAGLVVGLAAWKAYQLVLRIQEAITLTVTAAQIALNIAMASGALIPIAIAVAIAGLVAALVYLYRNNETARKIIKAAWAEIQHDVTAAIAVIREVITIGVAVILAAWERFGPTILRTLDASWNVIKTEVKVAMTLIKDIVVLILDIIHGRWGKIWDDLVALARDAITGVVRVVSSILRNFAPIMFDLAKKAGLALVHGVMGEVNQIPGAVAGVWKDIKSGVSSGWSAIVSTLKGWVNKLLGPVNSVLGFLHLPQIPGLSGGGVVKPATGRGPGYAAGGVVPGPNVGRDVVPAMLTPGEIVLNRRQQEMLGGHDYLKRLFGFDGAGRFGYSVGGIATSIFGAVRGAFSALTDPLGWLKAHLPKLPSAPAAMGKILTGLAGYLKDKVLGWVESHIPFVGGGGGAGPHGTAAAGANQRLGLQMMMAAGWPASQWGSLQALWMRESGWNQYAKNPSSGAYGIPQSLPASKMASAGADWLTNPATQIRWGLGYIRGRYGSPSGAWAHEGQYGWYGQGGVVPGGAGQPQRAVVHGGEMILTQQDRQRFGGLSQLAQSVNRLVTKLDKDDRRGFVIEDLTLRTDTRSFDALRREALDHLALAVKR